MPGSGAAGAWSCIRQTVLSLSESITTPFKNYRPAAQPHGWLRSDMQHIRVCAPAGTVPTQLSLPSRAVSALPRHALARGP